jgi:hypothetical protein
LYAFSIERQKKLIHDNQLINIAQYVNKNNIQFVASILKDKLPLELQNNSYVAVKLSADDKLFKIESFQRLGNKDY